LFGLDEAEYDGSYWRAEFLQEVDRHLSSQTKCMAYTYREGEISTISVFTYAWDPEWKYEGRTSPGLILFFSDQWTKGEGLYLAAAAVPNPYHEDYVDQLYEQRCP
jgi:hypothetical protein